MALSAAAGGKPTVARFVIVMGHFRSWHLGTVDAMQHYVRCRWQIRSGGEKLKALLLTRTEHFSARHQAYNHRKSPLAASASGHCILILIDWMIPIIVISVT
jgi:hypothetical protein